MTWNRLVDILFRLLLFVSSRLLPSVTLSPIFFRLIASFCLIRAFVVPLSSFLLSLAFLHDNCDDQLSSRKKGEKKNVTGTGVIKIKVAALRLLKRMVSLNSFDLFSFFLSRRRHNISTIQELLLSLLA
jgi:hypothetical protein